MTAPTCTHCNDTGKTRGSNDLDCRHCIAAQERSLLNRWLHTECGHMLSEDRVWAIYQRGKAGQPEAESLPQLILRTGSILAAANEQSRRKLYRFDVLDQRGTILAEGIGVHCHSMQEAEEKARKMLKNGESSVRFKSNAPCHPALKCAICSARPNLTDEAVFSNDGKPPDWKAYEAAERAEIATALRGLHGWAIEMLDMAEFKAWPDADRADFMLKMRAAEELLKNYPRKA